LKNKKSLGLSGLFYFIVIIVSLTRAKAHLYGLRFYLILKVGIMKVKPGWGFNLSNFLWEK